VFNAGFRSATIGDFDVSHDTININHTLFASVSAILAAAQPINSGNDTIITDAAHDTITLTGVTVAQLQAHPGDSIWSSPGRAFAEPRSGGQTQETGSGHPSGGQVASQAPHVGRDQSASACYLEQMKRLKIWRRWFARKFGYARLVCLVLLIGLGALRIADPAPIEELRVRTSTPSSAVDHRVKTARPVTIIDIDERSLTKFGQWPWPRRGSRISSPT